MIKIGDLVEILDLDWWTRIEPNHQPITTGCKFLVTDVGEIASIYLREMYDDRFFVELEETERGQFNPSYWPLHLVRRLGQNEFTDDIQVVQKLGRSW
jgi:hypothetical protein